MCRSQRVRVEIVQRDVLNIGTRDGRLSCREFSVRQRNAPPAYVLDTQWPPKFRIVVPSQHTPRLFPFRYRATLVSQISGFHARYSKAAPLMRPELLPPLSPGRASCRAGRHLDKPCRLQVHKQEEERVVSKHQIHGKLADGVTQNSEGLKRRDLLLSGGSRSCRMLAAIEGRPDAGGQTIQSSFKDEATPPKFRRCPIIRRADYYFPRLVR